MKARLAELPRDEDALSSFSKSLCPRLTLHRIKTYFGGENFYTFVLTDEDKLIASKMVKAFDPLYYFAVLTHPEYRRQGYTKYMNSRSNALLDRELPDSASRNA